MINTLFKLGVLTSEQGKVIDFANQTGGFVEVLFAIDGKEEMKEMKK